MYIYNTSNTLFHMNAHPSIFHHSRNVVSMDMYQHAFSSQRGSTLDPNPERIERRRRSATNVVKVIVCSQTCDNLHTLFICILKQALGWYEPTLIFSVFSSIYHCLRTWNILLYIPRFSFIRTHTHTHTLRQTHRNTHTHSINQVSPLQPIQTASINQATNYSIHSIPRHPSRHLQQ